MYIYATEQERKYCRNTDNWYMSSLYFKNQTRKWSTIYIYIKTLEGACGSSHKTGGTTLSVKGGI